MDFNGIMKEKLVSESCEEVQTRCGCITLKGVLHHYTYNNGYSNDVVEMTSPYPGKKRGLFNIHEACLIISDIESDTSATIALKKIYKQELKIRRYQRYLERNKAKIAELLPIWFEYDALMGYFDATERTERRKITRQARRGMLTAKEVNNELSAVRKRLNRYREGANHDFTKEQNRALRIGGLENLEFDYGDACRLFGDDVWEQMLNRGCYSAKHLSKDDKKIKLFTDFCEFYNIKTPELSEDAAIVTIGFDDIVLAVAIKQKRRVVAVGAIDDVRGRKALRVLVGDKRLAEILPKGAYNAVTRQESFYVRGLLYYRRFNGQEVITIY